jgi:carboxypeptidase Q
MYRPLMRHDALRAPISLAVALVALLGVASPGLSQTEPVDTAMIHRIEAEGMARSTVMSSLSHIADVIGPRLTGSPALKQAVDWVTGRLRDLHMDNVHQEAWPFGRGWTLEGLTLEMTSPRYFPLSGYPEAWTPSTEGVVEGEPVYVGDWTAQEIRARAAELKGRIVLATRPMEHFITRDRPQPADTEDSVAIGNPPFHRPEGAVSRRELPGLLREVGAAVELQPNQGEDGTIFVMGNPRTPDDAVPSIVMESEHYGMLVRMLQDGAHPRLRVAVKTRYDEVDTSAYNIIADIPGTDPEIGDQVVMLGAHLDSWQAATGATDNADAVASLLEAARILKTLGVKPRRTIRLAVWTGEEEGLLGSRAYAARHYGADSVANRARLSVYLNDDPGTGKVYGWFMQGNTAAKAVFDAWLAPLKAIGAKKNVIYSIGSTDHLSFAALGIPAFNTIQDYVDYDVRMHHTNQDFYERMRPEDLKQASIVLAVFLYEAAMRDEEIPRTPSG